MKQSKTLKYWFPVLLWMGFIFWMSTGVFSSANTSRIIEPVLRFLFPSISQSNIQLVHLVIRKMAHLTEYFVLGMLLFDAFRNGRMEGSQWRWALFSVLVLALYASGDELHQSFVSTRSSSIVDVCIDSFGGILSQCVSVAFHTRRRKKAGLANNANNR